VRRAIGLISRTLARPTSDHRSDGGRGQRDGPDELHHLFRRWAGLTPKAFMQR